MTARHLTQLASLRPQGPAARSIAGLWWLLLALGVAVFVTVVVLLVAGLFRRRRTSEDGEVGLVPERPGRWILLGGVAMPSIVLVVVLTATVRTMADLPAPGAEEALVVEVTGHQWWWEVRYPDREVVTANELHLPVGRPVELRLQAADVIHSFWVPALAGKLDLLPDRPNTLVVQADEAGRHHSECAEFCGLQHANMGLLVIAEPEADFDGWLADQASPAAVPTAGPASDGARLFESAQCATCHAVRDPDPAPSDRPGPDLTHVASRLELGAGVAPNTPDDLTRWITDPHALKEGVAMPASDLAPAEVASVVAYLETLT